MTGKVQWLRLMVGGACCALAVAAGEAATTVRTIQSGGSTQLRSVAAGADGLRVLELAPTFANFPNLQDGPDAAGASASNAPVSASLKQARSRMVNRSIARQRGVGEAIAGDNSQPSGAQLLGSFDGLTLRDQRLANGGNQFTVEPPDQGLCVGNGFVVETINDVIRVFDGSGNPLTGVVDLNTFYGYPAAFDRTNIVFGPSITDPSCYYDTQVNRFFHVALTF